MPVDYWAGINWREPRLQYRSTTANGPGRVGPLAVITFMTAKGKQTSASWREACNRCYGEE